MSAACRMVLAAIVALSSVAGLRGAEPEKPKEANPTYRLRGKPAEAGLGYSYAFSADSKRFAICTAKLVMRPAPDVAEGFDIRDMQTGKSLKTMRLRGQLPYPTALSPDGRLLASVGLGRNVSIWDVATGKGIQDFHGAGGAVFAMCFSPDGKLLAETSRDSVNIWDVATGKKVREFEEDGRFCGVAFSPDGQAVAAGAIGADRPIYAWGIATGKPLARYAGLALPAISPAAPDAAIPRLTVLFTANGDRVFLGGKDAAVLGLWEAKTGRLLYRRKNSTGMTQDAAISPDGRTVLTAQRDTVVLWDVFTGKERERLADSSDIVQFTSVDNGQALIGCGSNGIFVWDFAPVAPAKGAELTGPELDALWTELRTTDPRPVSWAVAKLIAAPDATVPFLRKHAKPVSRLDPKRIAQLIRDLDNDKFAVRQKAMDQLEKYGPMVDEPLRQALAAKPPLEVRRRIEQIRERQVSPYPTSDGDLLRTLRAIEVLEKIGTAEARRILETLAGGAVNARPTEEAKAALRRLARKAG